MRKNSRRKSGFTLIELLTVIAIIAILAAIIFPVFGRVRAQVRQTTTMSQMNEIQRNIKLYFADNGKYPAVLLGYVQNTDGAFHTGTNGTPVGIEQLTYRPCTAGTKYNIDKSQFNSPDNLVNNPTPITEALYPENLPASPDSFLTGQLVTFNQTIANNVRCTSKDGVVHTIPLEKTAYFYSYDSYDVGPKLDANGQIVRRADGQPVYELHYSIDWTGNELGGEDARLFPNQLKYPNAPEDSTVITWSTHQTGYSNSDKIPVMMLNGTAKPVPRQQFLQPHQNGGGPLAFRLD